MLLEYCIFIFFNDFDSSMLERFADKHLQDGLHLILIIKEIWITFKNLSCFRLSFWIWNEDCIWRPVDVVVWRNFTLGNEAIPVTELFPIVLPRHLLHLQVLVSLLLPFSLSLSLLSEATLPHLVLALLHVRLLHPLLLYERRIRLHIDRNDECGKRIPADNSTIVHNILRSYLSVNEKIKISKKN